MNNDESLFFEKFIKILYEEGVEKTIILQYVKQEGHHVEARYWKI